MIKVVDPKCRSETQETHFIYNCLLSWVEISYCPIELISDSGVAEGQLSFIVGCCWFLRALLEGSRGSCRPGRHKPIDVCFAAKNKENKKGVIVV
jgi:hypothetical protein